MCEIVACFPFAISQTITDYASLSSLILPDICLGSKSAGEENWSGERPTLTKSSYCSSATYTTATSDEDVTHYHAYTQTTSDSGDTLSRAMSQR